MYDSYRSNIKAYKGSIMAIKELLEGLVALQTLHQLLSGCHTQAVAIQLQVFQLRVGGKPQPTNHQAVGMALVTNCHLENPGSWNGICCDGPTMSHLYI